MNIVKKEDLIYNFIKTHIYDTLSSSDKEIFNNIITKFYTKNNEENQRYIEVVKSWLICHIGESYEEEFEKRNMTDKLKMILDPNSTAYASAYYISEFNTKEKFCVLEKINYVRKSIVPVDQLLNLNIAIGKYYICIIEEENKDCHCTNIPYIEPKEVKDYV